MTGIPTFCARCALPLDVNNITGVCLECKHIMRAAAASFTADEVPLDDARANFMDAFRGHYRPVNVDTVYMTAACRRCARFRARHDTGKCEWCSGPRRFPAKRSKKKTSRRRAVRKPLCVVCHVRHREKNSSRCIDCGPGRLGAQSGLQRRGSA